MNVIRAENTRGSDVARCHLVPSAVVLRIKQLVAALAARISMHSREAHHVTHRRGYRSATAAVAAPPTAQLQPLAASSGRKRGINWKSVVVTEDVLIVTGGFNTRPEVAKSILYTTDTTHSYVELDKNSAWFLKGVGGPKTGKGDLKAVQVLQEIREKFSAVTAVAAELKDEAEGSDDADDPMNALDTILESVAPKAKQKGGEKTSQFHTYTCHGAGTCDTQETYMHCT